MQSIPTRARLAPACQFFCCRRVLTGSLFIGVMGLVVLPAACKSLSPPGDETTSDSQSTAQSESDETSTLDSTVIEGDAQDVDYEIVAAMVDDDGTWLFSAEPAAAGGGGALTFEWDFGDGDLYYGQEQTYSLPNAGTYLIIVTAYKPNGHVSFVLSLELSVPGADQPPFADAGPDQAAVEGDQVILDGSASSDPDENDSITFSWSQVAGNTVTLVNADTATPTFFVPPIESDGLLVFVLEVSDGWLAAQDTIVVEVTQEIDPAGGDTFDCTFTVSIDGDIEAPLDGHRVLTPFLEALVSGTGLPAGAVYTWTIDGEEESELVADHTGFTRSFQTAGVHAILLTLVVGDLSTACVNSKNGASNEQVTVWPIVSGKAIDASGIGIASATVSANAGGTTAVTEADGSYTVNVPYGWTGVVSVQHVDYTFDPSDTGFANLIADEPFDFVAQSGDSPGGDVPGEPPPCSTNDDCDDSLFCNGTELCVSGSCVAGLNPCSGDSTCNESTDDCEPPPPPPCAADADCDDGVFCNGAETCNSGACVPSGGPCPAGQWCDETADSCVTGPMVFGTISLVDTVGHRPPVGRLSLTFTGSGAWSGTANEVATDVDGVYAQSVPDGWTGTVSATDSDRVFLLTPKETWTYGSGADAPAVTTAQQLDFTAWTAPIGIPGPEFGIKETHWMYQLAAGEDCTSNPEKCFDFGNGLQPYPDAGNGPYTHYMDNTHPNATNSGNPFGTPSQPRLSLHWTLAPGSVVEIHGGPYDSSPAEPNWSGTVQSPIFLVGVGMPRFTDLFLIGNSEGGGNTYVIVDGLSSIRFVVGEASHHVALRNCDQYGNENWGGNIIKSGSPSDLVDYIVFYNNVIRDNGIWDPDIAVGDNDWLGVEIGWNSLVEHVWIIDNDIFHNEGDAVQINAGPWAPPTNVNHIYVARNKAHHNKQTGITLKSCTDVIVSQNDVYGHRPSSSATGAGMGFSDDGPEVCWFIFNRIHDNSLGFKLSESWGTVGPHYLIGNVIYDIHGGTGPLPTDWAGPGQAFSDYHYATTKYIVANTIYDTDYGYCLWGADLDQPVTFANNIFSQGAVSGAPMIYVGHSGSTDVVTVTNNLFDGEFRIQWGGANYTSLSSFQAATGQGVGCLVGDARFSDPAQADCHLLADSPAVDTGVDVDVYDAFMSLYDIDIQVDIDGMPLPVDGNGDGSAVTDMGAYEYRQP